ncbi:hypothetical protein BUE80_DR005877 [Diplocarpon rosae]|nr:hypothetical protein BUE80_DR005877 [Diplocarpon rosae]
MPNNIARKARRKHQTRLTFEPLASSSPAGSNMAPAKVRYESTGGKKETPRQVEQEDDSEDEPLGSSALAKFKGRRNMAKQLFQTLPTPAKSSQAKPLSLEPAQDSDSEDSIIRSTQSTRGSGFLGSQKKKHKTTARIDRAADSSDGSAVEENNPSQKSKTANKQPAFIELSDTEPKNYTPMSTRSPAQTNAESSNSSGKSASRRARRTTPTKTTATRTSARLKKAAPLSDASEGELRSPKMKSNWRMNNVTATKKRLRKPAFIEINDEIDDDDPIVSSSRRSQVPFHKSASSESDSDEDVRSSPLKGRRSNIIQDDEDDDDEGEEKPVLSPLKRARQITESDDSDSNLPSPSKRKRSAPTQEDSDDEHLSPAGVLRRQKAKGKGKTCREPSEGSATPIRATRRQKTRRHRTAKEKQMELLKRRRAGEDIEELTESESDNDGEDEDFQKLDVFDDDEEDEVSATRVRKQAKSRRQRGDSSDEQAGESDFIVDDDEGLLGVPDYAALMPHEFTHAAHKPLKEHFRDVVEWMVQNKLNPGFRWEDEVYTQAFVKVDFECRGLATSKFVSTAWTAEFTRAVFARPLLEKNDLASGEGINILGEAKCEPCNHRSHNPSKALRFYGKPYHQATLEDVSDDDSDEEGEKDDSESDQGSLDCNGQNLVSQDKFWMSGSVCAQNAEQAHTLLHWKWHLNDWVVSNLENEGYLKPRKLAERDKMSSNKRMKLANKVVDQWAAEGKIKTLYHDFKAQIDTARELKSQSRGGWK